MRILLGSRFSMWMAWGPDLTFFCNDAYRRDTLGKKYPWALGRPAREVWAEIWPEIGPRIDAVMATGEATWDVALRLFLERSGYTEETYHTFSYSPLTDDDGVIAGMLCVVSEDTERVIGERRMATLRDLGADAERRRVHRGRACSPTAARHLGARNPHVAAVHPHLPLRRRRRHGAPRRPDRRAGRAPGGARPPRPGRRAAWPVADLAAGRPVSPSAGFTDLPAGAWEEPPTAGAASSRCRRQAAAGHTGSSSSASTATGPSTPRYQGFIDLIAGQLAASIGSARAYAAERRRAESLAELDRAKTDVLHQRQPRVPHAAHAAARPRRGRADRRRPRRCRPASANASRSCTATPSGC